MLNIIWAGWYKSSTSDKLWGVLQREDGAYYNFWCKRGARMQFKLVANDKYRHKADKGYKQIDLVTLDSIYPGFMEEANNQLIFGILAGTVR
jgi:hypothetical protein